LTVIKQQTGCSHYI